jgi:hypothetical protein
MVQFTRRVYSSRRIRRQPRTEATVVCVPCDSVGEIGSQARFPGDKSDRSRDSRAVFASIVNRDPTNADISAVSPYELGAFRQALGSMLAVYELE